MRGNNIFSKFAAMILALSSFVSITASCAKSNYHDIITGTEKITALRCELQLPISGICVDLVWETMQTETENGSFFLKFYAKNDTTQFIAPANAPYAQLFMPSMGHGSSPVHVEKMTEGIFKITNVYFSMPGEWDIRIQLKDGTKVVDQIVQKITI